MTRFVRSRSWPTALTLVPILVAALFVQTSAPPAAAAAPETLIFIGGLGSTTLSSEVAFAPLVRELVHRGVGDFRPFEYGTSSCESIDASTAELAGFLEGLRAQHAAERVILVGHSNGGVVALGAIAAAPDLAPFVERVVTVDSPLEGISRADAIAYGAAYGECPAADELYARSLAPGWSAYLEQLATWERGLGVDVRLVVNMADAAVLPDQQQIPGDVAYLLEASDPADWSNHSALLKAPAALAPIVAGD